MTSEQITVFDLDPTIEYFEIESMTYKNIKSCYNDLVLICNALYDYADLVEHKIENENFDGAPRAIYSNYVKRFRGIFEKISSQIGYDRQKMIEKCQKAKQKQKYNDIGMDAITATINKKSK